jgi:hypothetical protein
MLKKTIFLIFILSILIVPQTSLALDYTATSPATTTRTTIKSTLQTLIQERQALKDEMLAKMQTFREQIQTIKDVRKKMLVERIDDRIATADARLTSKMTAALTRMSAILAKIKTKGAVLKAQGKDTTALDAAIAAAETAIANAQSAVDTQAAKTYTATIGDDATLKNTIGQMVSGFRLDIMATYKTVIDAKQAVMKALSELAKLGGVGDTATGSGALQ